ncbi:MAG: transcription repressor NadR [Clostridiales bacterium]|nr:transcription repressor NadR [Candidatus Blautia equi]
MSGEERRKEIIRLLTGNVKPLSGSRLAELLQVSRQVVVQDMALLRAEGCEIFSTNRGYLIRKAEKTEKIFFVHHDDSRIQEELNIIVDMGGEIIDVFVQHEVYGELRGELSIDSRKKVKEFMQEINSGRSSTLNTITSGYHYHTVSAESQDILEAIEKELYKRGFLVETEE